MHPRDIEALPLNGAFPHFHCALLCRQRLFGDCLLFFVLLIIPCSNTNVLSRTGRAFLPFLFRTDVLIFFSFGKGSRNPLNNPCSPCLQSCCPTQYGFPGSKRSGYQGFFRLVGPLCTELFPHCTGPGLEPAAHQGSNPELRGSPAESL